MLESAIAILLVVYVISGVYRKENFIYYYIPINFLYDVLVYYLPNSSIFPIVRGVGTFVLLIYLLWNYKIEKSNRHLFIIFVFLIIQLSLLSYFSSSPLKSFSETLKFVNIMAVFYIGYSYFRKGGDLYKLFFALRIVLLVLVFNILIANIFKLGFKGYSGSGFYSGAIFANGWYTPAVVVIVFFFLIITPFKSIKGRIRIKNRKLAIVSLIISFFLIILGGRRSAVLILAISILFFLFHFRNRFKLLAYTFMFVLSLILISTVYIDILTKQYENRLNLYSGVLQEENRYVETKLLWNEMLSFSDFNRSIFGSSPFITIGNYGDEQHTGRYLHVDINIVLFSVGFWGLFLYLLYYISLFRLINFQLKKFPKYGKIYDINHLKLIVLSIYFSSVALSFSGGFSAITFRSTVFLIMGSILGYLDSLANSNKYNDIKEI